MRILPLWACGVLFASLLAPAQSLLHLQTRVIDPAAEQSQITASIRTADSGKHRVLIQLDPPFEDVFQRIGDGGGRVLGAVPVNGFVVSVPDGFDWDGLRLTYRAPLNPADKLGASLKLPPEGEKVGNAAAAGQRWYLVIFHEDVDPVDARRIALDPNTATSETAPPLELREHANLLAHHVLVSGLEERVFALANWDEVALILPASAELAQGEPVVACEGSVLNGVQMSPLAGAAVTGGWPKNAQGEAEIGIHFGAMTQKLSAAAALAEIRRALAEWARVARLRFTEGALPAAPRTFSFLFGTRDHGDPFPFTGSSGVIAHAFFPSPPNPEPLAGDVHFNDDMAFRIGADIDLFSVALHELGHALGLPHTDTPGAVMYPYYRMSTALSQTDIASIRQLYNAPSGTPSGGGTPSGPPSGSGTPTAALALNLNPPPARSTSPTLILEGTVTNANGAARVDWMNDRGGIGSTPVATGGAWRASGIPLQTGDNQIRLTAVDAAQARAERSVLVNRTSASTPVAAVTVAITEPSQTRTRDTVIRVRGTASHTSGIRRVTWTNGASGSGDASLSGNDWTIATLTLRPGDNAITITATSIEGGTGATTITLVKEVSSDSTPPQVVIQNPAGPIVSTTLPQITLTGTANDAGGIAEMTWTNSAGGNGAVSGVTPTFAQWRAEVKLIPGFNTITIRARDQAGNIGWRTLSVTRR